MTSYILKRILLMFPTFIGITLITFFMIKLAPGDPVAMKMNLEGLNTKDVSPEIIKNMRKQYGLDTPLPTVYNDYLSKFVLFFHSSDPRGALSAKKIYETKIPKQFRNFLTWNLLERSQEPRFIRKAGKWFASNAIQYRKWLFRMAVLDFGESLKPDRRPVLDQIKEALPITLTLNILDIFIVYIVSIVLGVYTALHRNTYRDKVTMMIMFVLYSLPSFWIAILLLMYFSSGEYLSWFPLGGFMSEGAESFSFLQKMINIAWHICLPVVVMVYGSFAYLSRFTRASMLEVLGKEYIRTARAKGLAWRTVIWKHGFRNALIPLITLVGTLLPALLGGSVIIEEIFSIPGMGKLSFDALKARDYTTIMGIATISAGLTLISLFLSDLAYKWVDPRVTFESLEKA